jgi:hypothetical protein
VRSLACAAFLVSLAAPAAAQETEAAESESAPAPAGAATKPPDIVRLKNGGLIRGTISELVPDDAVVILMVTGETRRVPMAEVEYAGPDEPAEHQAPAPKQRVKAPAEAEHDTSSGLTARLESVDVPITFFARYEMDGAGEYNELCTAPCDTTLTPGNYRFALAAPGGKEPLAAMPTLRITGPGTIRGKYRSRSGLRGAGVLVLIVGTVTGVLLAVTATTEEEDCAVTVTGPSSPRCQTVDVTSDVQLWTGITIAAASAITGLVLLTIRDSATVELVPGAPSGFRGPARFAAARDPGTSAASPLSGLSLVGRF